MGLLEKKGLNAELIPIQDFIKILSGYTGNTSKEVARFLLNQREFLRLDYYLKNDFGFNRREFDVFKDEEEPSYLNEDFLSSIERENENERIFYWSIYYWAIKDILDLKCMESIGLTEEQFYTFKKAYELPLSEVVTLMANKTNHQSKSKLKTIPIVGESSQSDTVTDENKNSRNQDDKLIVAMALLLAEQAKKFTRGNKPNASQIGIAVNSIANFMLQQEDKYGLTASDQRIRTALNNVNELIKKS